MSERAKVVEHRAFNVAVGCLMVGAIVRGIGDALAKWTGGPLSSFGQFLVEAGWYAIVAAFPLGIVSALAWFAQWSARHQAKQ